MYKALPLPLELSKPTALETSLNSLLCASSESATYDPRTQVAGGRCGGYNTSSNSVQFGLINVDDVLNDFTIVL
ncbi:MAG: hypothetical protein ACRDG4_09540 [Chloroflexota bacterium]